MSVPGGRLRPTLVQGTPVLRPGLQVGRWEAIIGILRMSWGCPISSVAD